MAHAPVATDKPHRMAKKLYIHNEDQSPRMFESDFIDKFSRVHWSIPLIIFVPVLSYFLYRAIAVEHVAWTDIAWLFPLGMFVWSFAEYTLHRFVFHWVPPTDFGKRMHFIFHGVHHDYPSDRFRLVMVPSMSVPLAFLFYFSFKFILGPQWVTAFFPGFVVGYLCYDLGHYSLHHLNWKNAWFQKLKKHHTLHHYKDPENGFGVSNKLWDHVFGTTYKD